MLKSSRNSNSVFCSVWRENAFTDESQKWFDISAWKGVVENISPTRLSLFPQSILICYTDSRWEWLESVNKMLQVSPMNISPLFITIKQFFVRTLQVQFCLSLPDGVRLHTLSPGPLRACQTILHIHNGINQNFLFAYV